MAVPVGSRISMDRILASEAGDLGSTPGGSAKGVGVRGSLTFSIRGSVVFG